MSESNVTAGEIARAVVEAAQSFATSYRALHAFADQKRRAAWHKGAASGAADVINAGAGRERIDEEVLDLLAGLGLEEMLRRPHNMHPRTPAQFIAQWEKKQLETRRERVEPGTMIPIMGGSTTKVPAR